MKRKAGGVTHREVLKRALAQRAVKQEYDALGSEFEVRRGLILLRRRMRVSQDELAGRIGTKQEYISRVEKGRVEMSLPYLAKLVRALNADIEITLKPRDGTEPIKTKIQV